MSDGTLMPKEVEALISGFDGKHLAGDRTPEPQTVEEKLKAVDKELQELDKKRFMLEIKRDALKEKQKEEREERSQGWLFENGK